MSRSYLLEAALEIECPECGATGPCDGKMHVKRITLASRNPDIIKATAMTMMYSGGDMRGSPVPG